MSRRTSSRGGAEGSGDPPDEDVLETLADEAGVARLDTGDWVLEPCGRLLKKS